MLLRSIEKVEFCTEFSSADIFAKAKDIEMRNMVRVFLIIIYKYIFAALISLLFHVKPYEARESETNIFVSISEPIKVGLEESKHAQNFRT